MAALTTPLGKDALLLTRMDVVEGLSELFEIRVDCLGQDGKSVDVAGLIGKKSSIRLHTVGKKTRHFNGIVVEADWAGEREAKSAYHLVMRPWLWLLSHTFDSWIYQNMTVQEIISDIFTSAGFTDFKFELSESYKKREYCVQYRESDLDFVLRLMEEEGIYYYFKHTASEHTLTIVDRNTAHKDIPDLPKVTFISAGERTRDFKEFLRDWTSERRFQTGKVTVKGFDFDKPTAAVMHDESSPGGYAFDKLERYFYPYKMKQGEEPDLGARYAKAVLQGAQAQDKRRLASGDAPSLFPGGLTTLEKHPTPDENKKYLVVRASHSFVAEQFRSGAGGGSADSYYGTYVLQLADRQFRAPHVTPRPVISGPQTAIVVGPAGEEIHTDKHGRIKLKFHWDRSGIKDDKASRWVRVAHKASGKSWGEFYIPRVGMEAVVEFMEGDPDRPLVVGTVYNADNPVPYALPANKTQRGNVTRSSKGGSGATYNELVFEDKKGHEFVRFHGEKDYMGTIEDTETVTIKGKNQSGPGQKTSGRTVEKGDNHNTIANGDDHHTVSRHRTHTIGKNETIKIGQDQKVTIKDNQAVKIGKTQKIDVGQEIEIKAGKKIVLKVGSSKITMTNAGITIETGGKIETQSNITNLNATALIAEKAGLITLN